MSLLSVTGMLCRSNAALELLAYRFHARAPAVKAIAVAIAASVTQNHAASVGRTISLTETRKASSGGLSWAESVFGALFTRGSLMSV
ncbi:hypothetical protein [Streptomyces rubiginosohelvolus]|uniref:hypothetical protein n=1 Tax=Streptomyces rubiginosohelvolus TaxID=67362 RepID=UPI0035D53FD7